MELSIFKKKIKKIYKPLKIFCNLKKVDKLRKKNNNISYYTELDLFWAIN